MCCFFGCHWRWDKKLSEVDEGIRSSLKALKAPPVFFREFIGKLSPVPISILPKKRQVRFGIPPQKKPGFRSFFHRKKKSAWFWGKVGVGWMPWRVRKIDWAQDRCPNGVLVLALIWNYFFLENNQPTTKKAKDLTKSGLRFWQTFWKKKTMDHILHDRILVWIRGTVCHVT